MKSDGVGKQALFGILVGFNESNMRIDAERC
jgi:hypothetical protein